MKQDPHVTALINFYASIAKNGLKILKKKENLKRYTKEEAIKRSEEFLASV